MPASPTARNTNAPRPQYQGHDTDYTLAEHKAACDDDELDSASLAAYPRVVYVLDDAADQPRDGEGRRVEESDSERDTRRDPFYVRQTLSLRERLESRDDSENDREYHHEFAALRRQVAIP